MVGVVKWNMGIKHRTYTYVLKEFVSHRWCFQSSLTGVLTCVVTKVCVVVILTFVVTTVCTCVCVRFR